MDSPSSSSLAGNVHDIQFDHKNVMYYAFERCDASLAQLFLKSDDPKKYNGPMPHHIDALLQLASGLEHIHSKNLVHGDIQPENVLISVGSAGKDETTLKWANVGQTGNVSERGKGKTHQLGGNNAWLAPELLSLKLNSNVKENNCKETAKSDVFAQGLVFGTLFLNGEHLYGSMENENEITQNIIKGNPINMQKIDVKLRDCYENDLLKKMLENDPGKRMTSTQVVDQLKSIKDKIAGKEKELLELCGRDNRLDLTEKIKKLIQFGINLNAKDNGGRNALHLMCRNYSSPKLTDAIKLLSENKTDVNAKDNDGLNAIHFLCRYHSSQNLIKAIQILIQSGIDAKATTNDGSNALHYLCRYNASPNLTDATKIFTKLGLDLMTEDNDGWSAFYYLQNKDKKEMKIWFDRDVLLGQGAFGTVLKGKFGGREVAVKRVELRHVDKREEDAMLKLEHPNIVKLLHVEKDNDFMYYALELCVASLDQLFLESDDTQKYEGPMPRQIKVFSQLASGLAYIHSKKLIHRDIKPSNILIMKSPGKYQEIIIKWSDFGLVKSVNGKGLHSWSGVRGTRKWYAPEVLRKLINGERAENKEFWGTVQSDVFVLGLVFGYLFLKGEHLYGCSETEIHKNISERNPVNMQKINGELRKYYEDDLLMKMLEDDPKKRITSKEVVEQLESINKMLIAKEEELRQLCARDSSSDIIEKINDLIKLGVDVNAKDIYGQNALHCLCENNSNSILIDAIQLLIQLGIDVNANDEDGLNALHHLCRKNSNANLIDAIRLLIQLRIPVVSDGHDARSILRRNYRINNKDEILKLLDEAALV
ncbi:RGS domain-containing serine/threonine-protein kinase A isoform X2 [Daphnia magna]|uniref:RGS domain-containing serine/threonine-protein kinase A isoform X2 n=1 Tax=Daphnia magna TaxID=35525 RepID=UPI001E1BAA95|nr:RGS domain-containing serine/threonine-protein kinase A isoform X2 [Daphnia magna]